jgi:hypothetical protein
MRVSFLRQASGLFVASRCRRDNYKKGAMKSNRCSQSKNSFPVKVSDWTVGRYAVIRSPKFRGWLWRGIK